MVVERTCTNAAGEGVSSGAGGNGLKFNEKQRSIGVHVDSDKGV